MIRTLSIAALVSLGAAPAVAQQPADSGTSHQHAAAADHSTAHMSGWKELDDYHKIMMAVWHPAKQSDDLKPIRQQAAKLADAADIWAKAEVPKACDALANREGIARVRDESKALAALVASGTDAQVKEALAALHSRFETVNHACAASHH